MRDPGETTTMEQLGPSVLLALALVGVALIVTLFVMRRVRGTGRTAGQADQAAAPAAPIR